MHNTPETPNPGRKPYPGRSELETAYARFRRAVSRLNKEATRHDAALLPRLEAIVTEAAQHLDRLAVEAQKAEDSSARHRAALAREKEKTTAVLRKAVRQGSPHAGRILARIEQLGDDVA
ncbi:hypothetical protein [Streptomyces mangrovi]|uniref:hypothetical protein n=1 Tax=Streptomyces mangrovi TaxID=1206892 RepID=UPI00399D09F0